VNENSQREIAFRTFPATCALMIARIDLSIKICERIMAALEEMRRDAARNGPPHPLLHLITFVDWDRPT
jgi:hypothetical protein